MAIKVMDIEDNLEDSVLVYSININARTFPDVRTGLKSVATRTVYSMHKNKRIPGKVRRKVNTVAGEVLVYHPHGNASVEDAIYKMAQPFYNNVELMDAKGKQ